MYLKRIFYFVLISLFFTGLTSCLGGSDDLIEGVESTNAQISSFALTHDSVPGLSKTKFSINQVNSVIYNHDSLPYLTDTYEPVKVTYTTSGAGQQLGTLIEGDTIWVASGDSIDIAKVSQFVVFAPNAKTQKTYTLKVNIHRIDPDSVQYHPVNPEDFHLSLEKPWEAEALALSCPVVAALGYLHPDAADLSGKGLALVVNDGEDNRFALWAGSLTIGNKIPEDFPLSGFSVINNRSLYVDKITIIKNMQSVWATENGLYWAKLSNLPEAGAIEGGTAFTYNNEIWFIGGKYPEGEYNREVFSSRDGGMVWKALPAKTQVPEDFIPRTGARVVTDPEGVSFYIAGGQNGTTVLDDIWQATLNSRLFEQ